MSAEELISFVTELTFAVLAVVTITRAIRRPRLVKVHTAAFFTLVAGIVLTSWARDLELVGASRFSSVLVTSLLVALPYPLLRLAGDFTGIRGRVRHAAEAGVALSVAGIIFLPELPDWFILFVVVYFVATTTYASWQFVHAAATMRSVSRIRMTFAAGGAVMLALLILVVGFQAALEVGFLGATTNLLSLATGLLFYVAFAMPPWVKRAIHAVPLQAFIHTTVEAAPRLYRDNTAFEEIEHAIAQALGTPNARIGLWDEEAGELRAPSLDGQRHPRIVNPHSTLPYRAYVQQQPVFSEDAGAEDPDNAELSAAWCC